MGWVISGIRSKTEWYPSRHRTGWHLETCHGLLFKVHNKRPVELDISNVFGSLSSRLVLDVLSVKTFRDYVLPSKLMKISKHPSVNWDRILTVSILHTHVKPSFVFILMMVLQITWNVKVEDYKVTPPEFMDDGFWHCWVQKTMMAKWICESPFTSGTVF
jgi:hypothetical protein